MRTLIILVLVGLILGGSAYFGYELYWKPRQLDREDKAAAESGEIPDYTLPIFEKAAALEQSGDIEGARAALGDFIRNFPTGSETRRGEGCLGSNQYRPSLFVDSVTGQNFLYCGKR